MIARHPGACRPHAFQDQRYGPGYRVMNPATVKGKIVGYRCSVCSPKKESGKRRPGIYDLSDLLRR